MEYFKIQKPLIENFLKSRFLSKEKDFAGAGLKELGLPGRLLEFASAGKMIRGGLVLLTHSLFRGENGIDAVRVAGAMELIQSGFLIHDDIMDRDSMRRGGESLHWRYKKHGESLGSADPVHFGESLGICAGDLSFFEAFEILSTLECSPETAREIFLLFSRETSNVALAQANDVYYGALKENPGEDAVIRLYTYKTGRYTFSLPLIAGAVLAGMDGQTLGLLERIGELLGQIFQIKDDEIGLFGSEEETGKPAGSDIKENKKSLYHYYLFLRSGTEERRKLSLIFGSPEVTKEGLEFVRSLILSLGIIDTLSDKIKVLRDEAESLMDSLPDAESGSLTVLHELLDYSVTRSS